jgi:SAM-dependent methyltransferase
MELQMSMSVKRRLTIVRAHDGAGCAIATAYNQAGDKYLAYADGDPDRLYAFDGQYSHGDRCIWELLDTKLRALRAAGATSIRILDLGCGPGTWLRRVVTRARVLGFDSISARGFDIADAQVRRARELATDLSNLPGVRLSFEIGDIFEPLAESDTSVDLCVCLCAVLNHIPTPDLSAVLAEVARVTAGCFVTTVRAVGSTPTVYVDAIEQARRFRQDNLTNRLDVEFQDGHRVSLNSHLFSAAELRSLVAPHLDIDDIRGIDLFHGRFAADPRWNPRDTGTHSQFCGELDQLEKAYCRDAEFIDHATHLLLVGRRRKAVRVREQPKIFAIGSTPNRHRRAV